MKIHNYNYLFFDADNTLFDFDKSSEIAFEITMQQNGIEVKLDTYKQYKQINKKVWTELEKGLIDQIELRSKRFRLFLEHIEEERDPVRLNREYLSNLVQHSSLYAETLTILNALVKTHKLGIITNGLKEVQRPRIIKTNIAHFFELIVVSDEIGFAKPHPGFFDYAFGKIGQPTKSEVLIIGDSLATDIKGGNDYGLDTCWFNPNGNSPQSDITPTFTIQRLLQLI